MLLDRFEAQSRPLFETQPAQSEEAWYALYTRHQHEKSASALLQHKGFEVLLPVYRAVHRWSDRKQTVILPLFPGYVFIRASLERKLDILRTPGVRWIVENAGRACSIPEPEIKDIHRICTAGTRVLPHPFLKQGDRVRIREGALAGIEGILVRVKNECRVVISVEPLQKSLSIEVDFASLESLKVPCNPHSPTANSIRRSA